MQIYDLKDSEGRVYAFEVDNLLLRRAAVAMIVQSIPGARVLTLHRSWWGPDEFCEFEVGGIRFTAWEPWGDSDRYWIGPEPPHFSEHTATVRAAFASHTATPLAIGFAAAAVRGALAWTIKAVRRKAEGRR